MNELLQKEKNTNVHWRLLLERAVQRPASNYEQAVMEATSVLDHYREENDEEGTTDAYIALGNIHNQQKDYKKALHYDSLALALAEKANFAKGKVLAYRNLGRESVAAGNILEAKTNYEKALELELTFNDKDSDLERLLSYYNQLGITNRILGKFEASATYLNEGIRLAEKNGRDRALAQLYMNLGNTFSETSRYEEAVTMHLRSVKIKEHLNDSLGLGQSFTNLSIVFRAAKEFDKAIAYLRKSQQINSAFKNHKGSGLNAANLAVIYIEKKELDSVPVFFEQAIANFSRASDNRGLALAFHNYGKFLFDMNRLDTAEIMMEKALALRKKAGSDTEISTTLANLGQLEMSRGNFAKAEHYLLDAQHRIDTTKTTRALSDLYTYLSELYRHQKNYEKAFAYLKKVLMLEKNSFTENERVALLKAESKYELEKRDLELALEREKQRDHQFRLFLIGVLIAMALIAIISVLWIRRKQVKERHQSQLQQLTQTHRIATAQALRKVEEEERKKIANKLHDEVGALLSIAKLNVDQLEADVFAKDSEAVLKLQTAKKLLGDMGETVRAISHSLVPVALEKYGLKPAILDLINAVNISGKIKVEEVIEGLDRADDWSDEFRFGLYRILQEVLNNIIKHAQATHVLVQLVELERSLTIYVEDNGKGLDMATGANGMGLNLLKRNIEYFNGVIEINGRQNQGTFVLIELPLDTASAH
ncbi:ATP-binding protein [Parapedobacter koreensis]|uniref:ATP-binding protein n=1 Tax=Parapedobacter koreensis TaxID=332977 RepID=UPI0015A580EC|nr:tetratricopeptide repeat protein [Parapedobacter koreensis]